MRFQITSPWSLHGGTWVVPANTIIDASSDNQWSVRARGLTPPITAKPLDAEAHEAQVRAYPDHRYLLSGGWEEK
jgi:hypothetical protein